MLVVLEVPVQARRVVVFPLQLGVHKQLIHQVEEMMQELILVQEVEQQIVTVVVMFQAVMEYQV